MKYSIFSLVFCGAASVAAASAGKFFDPASYDARDVISRDVAIIGGGATGTYAAIWLSDMGQGVVVVEKQALLGGQTSTYEDPSTGRKVDYGVKAFWNTTVVREFFARLDVAPGPLGGGGEGEGDGSDASQPSTVYADFQTGKTLGDFTVNRNLTAYATKLEEYPYLLAGWHLPDPVPEDLLLPFGDFIEKYSLQDIAYTLFNSAAAGGMGTILDQSTVYVFKALSEAFMDELDGNVVTTAEGNNQELYDNALKELGSNVMLESTVIAARRQPSDGDGDSPVSLVVKSSSGGTKLINASKLLVTIPLQVDNLRPFDLDSRETEVFSEFQNTAYYCGLIRGTGLPAGASYVNAGQDTMYNIPELPAMYHVSPTALDGIYSFWYGADKDIPEDRIKDDISATVQRLAGGNAADDGSVEFVTYASHTPFNLHVSPEAIADGLYTDLNGLQGYRNTWYTGIAFTPSSATLWDFTKQLLPKLVDAS